VIRRAGFGRAAHVLGIDGLPGGLGGSTCAEEHGNDAGNNCHALAGAEVRGGSPQSGT